MIRSKYHTKTPMNHKIRIRITRDRWTPEDIEAGDSHDLGECWDELFEDEEEADAYLWRHLNLTMADLRAQRDAGADMKPAGCQASFGAHGYYSDEGDTRETIENGGTIEWTATLVG